MKIPNADHFVLEGVGRIRVGDETLAVPKYGGVLVRPEMLRQVFNDTSAMIHRTAATAIRPR